MELRASLSEAITKLGGDHRSDLSAECTHLVCDPLRTRTGEDSKYHHAKIWKLSIVSLNWLKACIKSNCTRELFHLLPRYLLMHL
jgi:twin BRCT domain